MKLILAFILRWIITSFGLWLALQLFGEDTPDVAAEPTVYLLAGLILSVVNIFIKPLVAIISLPFTILTLGLFTFVINGLMVYIALRLTPGMDIAFWSAVLVSVVIGIVNFVINQALGTLKAAK